MTQASLLRPTRKTDAKYLRDKVLEAEGYKDDAETAAGTANAQAAAATSKAAEGAGYATNALNSQNQAAASAALAQEIANIADVQKFTALASAHAMVLFAGGTSSVTGIQIPSNTQNNHGVSNWTPHFKGYLPAYTGATRNLRRKHDGVQGYILDILTDKKIRLTLNGFTYTSTVAASFIDGDINEVEASITRETASAAGQVLFIVNGAQVGDAVVIAAHGSLTEELYTQSNAATGANATTGLVGSGGTLSIDSVETDGQPYAARFVSNAGGGRLSIRLDDVNGTLARGGVNEVKYYARGDVGAISVRVSTADEWQTTNNIVTGPAVNADSTWRQHTIRFIAPLTGPVYLNFVEAVGPNDSEVRVNRLSVKRIASIDNTATEYIMGSSSTQTEGGWLRSLTYNRAISAADALARIKRGVPHEFTGASNTRILSDNFEAAGLSGWNVNGGATLVRDTAAPLSGVASLKGSVSGSNFSGGAQKAMVGVLQPGLRYAARFKYKLSAPGTMFLAFDSPSGGSIERNIATNLTSTTTTEVYTEFTIPNSFNFTGPFLVFYPNYNAGAAFDWWLDDIEIWPVGVVQSLSAEDVQSDTGQVFDAIHGHHGVMPASRAKRSRRNLQPQHRSRHTWLDTSEEQYVTLFNQPVVPDNEYFEGIVVIPTGSTLTGFTIGNGSNSAYYATVAGPITSGVPIYVALDKRFPDSNRKLTIKPTGTFNGSLVVTAHGRILEVAA